MIYKSFTSIALSAIVSFSSTAQADYLTLPSEPATRAIPIPKSVLITTPQHGDSQERVLANYGQPLKRHPTVSKNGPSQQPPITRWDYQHFAVVFEKETVITSIKLTTPNH